MNNEETIESLRKKTTLRLTVMSTSLSLPIIIVLVLGIGKWKIGEENSIFEKVPYVPYIIAVLLLGWIIWKIVGYIRILNSNEYAEKVLIIKNDERNKYIRLKSNDLILKIFIYALGVITIFSAFVDYQYFIACVGIFVVLVIINVIVTIYYNKKF